MNSIINWHSQAIFISSTFRDMHAERGYLQDIVFPALEKKLQENTYPYHLEPIDLRWGVETADLQEEHQKEIEVLKVCLNEINRSRPFMIVLLGDRYGWVPPKNNMKRAIEDFDYLHDINGRSVTALEIEYGILNSLADNKRCFFYFRQPLPYEKMPPEIAARYNDEYNPDEHENYEKLQYLKQCIEEAGLGPVKKYTADWDEKNQEVTGLEAFAEMVIEDLWKAIQEEYQKYIKTQPQTWQEQEHWLLEQYIENRYPYYHSSLDPQQQTAATIRQQTIQTLKDYLLSTTLPNDLRGICLTGEPGAGKSTLFARLYREMQQEDVLILAHAGGISTRAGNTLDMLRIWIQTMSKFLGIEDSSESLNTRQEIEDTFALFLSHSAVQKRVIIMIDALNEFQDNNDRYLTWIPEIWPKNARLLITTITGTEPQERHMNIHPLEPLSEEEATIICQVVCSRYRKALNPRVQKALLTHDHDGQPSYGNPLWIQLALNEIITLDEDDYARLEKDEFKGTAEEKLIAMLLDIADKLPPDVPGLYQSLIEKLEDLFGQPQVRSLLSLIAASRMGLRERDLKQLMPIVSGQPWQDLTFARIRNYLRTHLVQRGSENLWNFFHQQAKIAVNNRYFRNHDEQQYLHATIAGYLESLDRQDPLRISELMYHYIQADNQLKTARHYASNLNDNERKGATRALSRHIINSGQEEPNPALEWVCTLLQNPSLEANEVWYITNRYNFDLLDSLEKFTSLSTQVTLLNSTMMALTELIDKYPENTKYQRGLTVSLERLGSVERTRANLTIALEYYKNAHKINQELVKLAPDNAEYRRDLSISYNQLGSIEQDLGNLDRALGYYNDALKIIREMVNTTPDNAEYRHSLSVSYNHLGKVEETRGNLLEALGYYKESLEIRQGLVNMAPNNADYRHSISVNCNHLGKVEETRGNLLEALGYYQESLEITNRLVKLFPNNLEYWQNLWVDLNSLGKVEETLENWAGARQYYQDGLEIIYGLVNLVPDNTMYRQDLLLSYIVLGKIEQVQGEWARALSHFKIAQNIANELTNLSQDNAEYRRSLSIVYDGLGRVEMARNNYIKAMNYYKESFAIRQELANLTRDKVVYQRDLITSFNNLGDVEMNLMDWVGASVYFKHGLKIARRLVKLEPANTSYRHDLSLSYHKLGVLEETRGNRVKALKYFRDGVKIGNGLVKLAPENVQYWRELSINYRKLGGIEETRKKWAGAMRYYKKSLYITRKLLKTNSNNVDYYRDLVVAYINLFIISEKINNKEQAEHNRYLCFTTLQSMDDKKMPMDDNMTQMYQQLKEIFPENDNLT